MEVTVNIPGVINEEVGGKSILPKKFRACGFGLFIIAVALSVVFAYRFSH
jgi:hypothetical protein